MGYWYIFGTIFFTVYRQIILKLRISMKAQLPENGTSKEIITYFVQLFLDPFIVSGFAAAFVASLFWMAAMTKFEITFAYPFMSLAPALVLLLGIWILGETFTIGKLIGLFIIIIGLIVTIKL
jgi:undecaprenyl phosphate-alpha-L-ara4N flippase subunit ArnF